MKRCSVKLSKQMRLYCLSSVIGLLGVLGAGAAPAHARAGGGRSVGRSSGSVYRGSRSQPMRLTEPMRAAPYRAPVSTQPPPQVAATAARGGFLRNMAGGVAGGFLGSMLFSSLGHGIGNGGGYADGGNGGGGRGGLGILDLLLIGGLGFLAFRWWRSRQSPLASSALSGRERGANVIPWRDGPSYGGDGGYGALADPVVGPAALPAATLTRDEASDLFFKIQGAWTRRDIALVRDILGTELAEILGRDLAELRAARRVNRLENISVRNVDIGEETSREDGVYVTARFDANLLDYTVDEGTGAVVAGSSSEPVKFTEDWTFRHASGDRGWQVVAIDQV
jgi:predicted lipid-binding transport protein (Tim44 family)